MKRTQKKKHLPDNFIISGLWEKYRFIDTTYIHF